jgi:hypothetical protein
MIFFKKKKLTSGMGCQVSVIAGSDSDQQEDGGGQTKGSDALEAGLDKKRGKIDST